MAKKIEKKSIKVDELKTILRFMQDDVHSNDEYNILESVISHIDVHAKRDGKSVINYAVLTNKRLVAE